MRTVSLNEILLEYGIDNLDDDDKESREELLSKYPFSLIVEAEFMELDNLERWIKKNLLVDNDMKFLFYGKTDYNFGFAEYFFKNKNNIDKIQKVIPNIYTVYPNSYPPNNISKTNGKQVSIDLDSNSTKNAIIYYNDDETYFFIIDN